MNKTKFGLIFLLTVAFCGMPSFLFAQKTGEKIATVKDLSKTKSEVQTHRLKSNLMKREMPYRVVLPLNYAKREKEKFAVIYLLHGLTGHFDNWTDKTKLADYASRYNFIIVTPEGGDGWYSDSVNVSEDMYESYIIQELVPEIDKNFRTFAVRGKRMIAGLSMGGYGSLKFGLKYPEHFILAGSFSGALGVTALTDKNSSAWISKSVMSVFGQEGNASREKNDIFKIVRNLSTEDVKKLPFLYLDCGTEDFLIQNNRDFMTLLSEKKIPHEFRQLPGKHDWIYWDKQVQEFLRLSEKTISQP